MGYTTFFYGRLDLGRNPTEAELEAFDIARRGGLPGAPRSRCGWWIYPPHSEAEGSEGLAVLDNPGYALAWDQNEKFYHYFEWLEFLAKDCLWPAGIELSGTIYYQGEDEADCGKIVADPAAGQKLRLVRGRKCIEYEDGEVEEV